MTYVNQSQSYLIWWLRGFPASWTNIIQMIFKFGERCSPGNYRTIMLGTIFGKIYGIVLEKTISRWGKFKGVRVRGQVGFKEDRSTLDHILSPSTLMEQDKLVG